MYKIFYFICKTACVVALFVGLQQLIELKTHGFYLQKILTTDLIVNPDWDIPDLSSEEKSATLQLLDQPFIFLGAGSECFAFLGSDGKTVIKFFKLDHFRPVYFFRGVFAEDHRESAGTLSTSYSQSSPFRPLLQRIFGMREYRIGRTFQSIKVAYDHLKEETGLIYLHLNPTHQFHKTLLLYDPNGIAHEIDLDSTRFYLQKRAIPLEKHLRTLKANQEHARAEHCIASLCDLILQRCQKGFADRDPYAKNFGFIDDRAVEIDTGSFIPNAHMKEPRLYKQDLLFIALEMKKWAKNNYPELLIQIDAYLAKELNQDI